MKYLVVGAGGTGGSLGAYLADGGKDVTYIARGVQLEAIKSQGGLCLDDPVKGRITPAAKACTAEEYDGKPDVILVCVKGFAIDSIIPLIAHVGKGAVVIPILNIVATGRYLADRLPDSIVLDGCIYVSASISAPGRIAKPGKLLKIVFGEHGESKHSALLEGIAREMRSCGIETVLSGDIARDAYRKYLFLSPFATAGAYLDYNAGQLMTGEGRNLVCKLCSELTEVARAQGIVFDEDMTEYALGMLANMPPEGTTSMQKDIAKGGDSEADGLVMEPVRLAERYNVAVPCYRAAAAKLCPNG